MDFLGKMERRFGRYAIRNLPLIMIGMQVIGYSLSVLAPGVFDWLAFSPDMIMKGQVWRLITWVLMPPTRLDIFTVIMLFFYYWIARVLAATWGDFYFNVYIFGGILIMDIGMMISYFVFEAMGTPVAAMNVVLMSMYVTTYYIQTTILLAFALTYPDMQVLLYFFIPVKMSWMGILYGVFLAYDFYRASMATPRLVMIMALLNFALYFLMTGSLRHMSPSEIARRARYRKASGGKSGGMFGGQGGAAQSGNRPSNPFGSGSTPSGQGGAGTARGTQRAANAAGGERKPFPRVNPGGLRHRCTICGRTEADDPNLEFRYCSRCEGSYEYCQDHLFTHKHIKNGVPTEDPQ